MDLVASPIARRLLDLQADSADGELRLGARVVRLQRGQIVGVTASEGDGTVVEFLIQTGRLNQDQRDVLQGDDIQGLHQAGVDPKVVQHARRATWIDRLVRAMRSVETEGDFRTLTLAERDQEPLIPLLLDALARLAAEEDAGVVGAKAGRFLRFGQHPGTEDARAWADVRDEDLGRPLAHLLMRHPGAASRVAALIRAGFARLADDPDADAPPASSPPEGRTSLEPPRAPLRVLTPGAQEDLETGDVSVPLITLPAPSLTLDDPLSDAEARIVELESMGAPGPERAEAWRTAAQIWQREFGAIEECARAYREAAAADPTDYEVLRSAAMLCRSVGQLDLAEAYASAATAAAPQTERGSALLTEARLAERRGQHEQAREHLRNAAAEHGDAEAHVLLAELEADPDNARELRRAAALGWRVKKPKAARLLLASIADTLDDQRILGQWRAADGHVELAVLELARQARESRDSDHRRALRMLAAELAEEAGRHDLAFDRLVEAHIDEPFLEVLYEPLIADGTAAGWSATVAVWLERLGNAADWGRENWFLNAARAFEKLPAGREWAVELVVRTLARESNDDALQWLRDESERTRDVATLADGLERCARGTSPERIPLLIELAEIAEKRLGTVHRALWAWRRVAEIDPDYPDCTSEINRLRDKARVKDGLVELAEEDFNRSPSPQTRRKLAAMLRDHPTQRQRAAQLYREVLQETPEDRTAFAALERMLRLTDEDAWIDLLIRRSESDNASRSERLRAYWLASGVQALREEHAECAETCQRWLRLAPQSRVAVARLELAGQLLNDPTLIETASLARLELPSDTRHARVHAQLGAAAMDDRERMDRVRTALSIDARAADAALLALDLAPSSDAAALLESVQPLLGEERQFFEAGIRNGRDTNPAAAQRWVSEWSDLEPHDSDVAALRLRMLRDADDADAIQEAADHGSWVLANAFGETEQVVSGIHQAADRLASLGRGDAAAKVLTQAVDRAGHPEFLATAERLAESPTARRDVAERQVAWARDRPAALRALAELHQRSDALAAEARAWLRLLAWDPHEADALRRLAEIYASTGEDDRLLAVLALRLEAAESGPARVSALRDMAAAARRLGRQDEAESFLAQLEDEQESDDDVDAALESAAVLVASGDATAAIGTLATRARALETPGRARLIARAIVVAEKVLEDAGRALRVAVDALVDGIRSPEIMLAFERLALQRDDVALARDTYARLAENAMGRHGRRGTRYREARWLERAGRASEALEAYRDAFIDAPSEGVVFSAIERLGRETESWEILAQAYIVLAERQSSIDHRLALVTTAAQLFDEKLSDPQRAFELLHDTWRTTQRSALLPDLRRLAVKQENLQDAMAKIHAGLRARIEMTWDAKDQVITMGHIASVYAEDQDRLDDAIRVIDEELLPRAAEDPDEVPARVPAGILCQLATWLQAASRHDEAQQRALDAHAMSPEEPAIIAALETLGVDPAQAKKQAEEEAKRKAEEEAQRKAEEEEAQRKAEEEEAQRKAEEEEAQRKAEEEAQRKAEEEAQRKAEEEAQRKAEEEEAQRKAEEEAQRKAEEEAQRKAEEEEAQRKAEEEAQRKAEEEAQRKAEEEAQRKAEEEAQRKAEEEAQRKAEEEAQRKAEEEAQRKAEEEEAKRKEEQERIWADERAAAEAEEQAQREAEAEAAAEKQREAAEAAAAAAESARVSETYAQPEGPRVASEVHAEERPSVPPALDRWRSAAAPAYDEEERALRASAADGSLDAAETLGLRLTENPDRIREGTLWLLRVLRDDPSRVEALRALQRSAEQTGAAAIAEVCADIRSLFDGTAAPQRAGLPTWTHFAPNKQALRGSRSPLLKALALTWTGARPLFRRNLREFGVLGTQRITPLANRPLGGVLREVVAVLDADAEVFAVTDDIPFRWVSSTTPALLIAEVVELEETHLRVRLARALELAKPENLLLMTRPEPEARTLIDGLWAAFGPAEAVKEVERTAARFAGDLWRTLSPRDQSTIRDLFSEMSSRPSFDRAWEEARRRAACGALMVEGSVADTARGLSVDEPSLAGQELDTPIGYRQACAASGPLRTLIRMAFSDAYIAARGRLSTGPR